MFTISRTQLVVIAATLFITIPTVLFFVFGNEINALYLREVVAPKLKQQLGFEAGYIEVNTGRPEKCCRKTFAITAVQPGGEFDRAGVKPGDIPYGYVHAREPSFWSHLNSWRGQEMYLVFIPSSEAASESPRTKEVRVRVPR